MIVEFMLFLLITLLMIGAGDPSLVYDKFANVEKLLEKVIVFLYLIVKMLRV